MGANVIHQRRTTALDILIRQLRNPLLLLLLSAAVVSALTGDPKGRRDHRGDIVALSVGLAFFNEYRSAQALAALHEDIRYEALAWCDGCGVRVDVVRCHDERTSVLHAADHRGRPRRVARLRARSLIPRSSRPSPSPSSVGWRPSPDT